MDLRKAIVSTDVTGIAFGFYSAEEIRKISVKALSNPQAFDILGNPLEGGSFESATQVPYSPASQVYMTRSWVRQTRALGAPDAFLIVANDLQLQDLLADLPGVPWCVHLLLIPKRKAADFMRRSHGTHRTREPCV